MRAWMWWVLAAIAALFVISLVQFPSQAPATAPLEVKEEGHEGLLLAMYQRKVSEKLRDPDSAKFKGAKYYAGGSAEAVCGEVNSKNGMGGYTGFQQFVFTGKVALQEQADAAQWGRVIEMFCKSKADATP